MSYFARAAWKASRMLRKTLQAAWAHTLKAAKAAEAIQAAKRRAKAMDKAKAAQQTGQPFSFRSNAPITVAQYGQTGRQLQKGKDARETFTDIPVIRVRKSKYYDR